MPPVTNANYRNWLKSAANMKLSSDAAVLRLTYEGITNFDSFLDFDRESIESLSKACARTIPAIAADDNNGIAAEAEIPGANLSTISIRRLVVATHAVKYYTSIGRTPDFDNMHYVNVLSAFRTDYEAYMLLRKQDAPDVSEVNDKDREKKIIKWVPLFEDALSRTFGSKGPLVYVVRDNAEVPTEEEDPLLDNCHYGSAGSLVEELIKRLPHNGPIFKDDNKTVYMMVAKAVAGTSVESTINSFSRRKDGRGAFQALIANHAGDTKYRAIVKARNNLLQNVKWNGCNYPLEQHVSNHRTAVDDLRDCANHIGNAVPTMQQRVEFLLDSIVSQDSALQAAMGNIRADTQGLRGDFENAASHLIEVDPYRRASNPHRGNRNPKVSSVTFAGRGKTGVDLRWHMRKEFRDLISDQKDELVEWQQTDAGKSAVKKQREETDKKRKSSTGNGWKKNFKKALNTKKGLSHVMSTLMEAEQQSAPLVAALQPTLPTAPAAASVAAPAATPTPAPAQVAQLAATFPALSTKVKLTSILKPN